MPPLLLLRRVIQGAVGERHVIGDADVRARYETDWTGRFHGEAACVVRPGSADDVAAVRTPGEIAAMAAIKRAPDPGALLNPGVGLPGDPAAVSSPGGA